MVAQGTFRKDLFYRINTITIDIPPLCARREDIIPLAEFFLEKYSHKLGKTITALSVAAQNAVKAYSWPGNVRELRNVIERAVVLSNSAKIQLFDLPMELHGSGVPEGQSISRFDLMERKLILDALDLSKGNITTAAKILGVSRGKLRHRMEKHGL